MATEPKVQATGRTATVRVVGSLLTVEQTDGSKREDFRLSEIVGVTYKPYEPLAPRSGLLRIRLKAETRSRSESSKIEVTIYFSSHASNRDFRALNLHLQNLLRVDSTARVGQPKAHKSRHQPVVPAASDVQLRCRCGRKSKTQLRSKPSREILCTQCHELLIPAGTRMVNSPETTGCGACPGRIEVGRPVVLMRGSTWHVGCVPNLSIPELREGQKRTSSRRTRSVRAISGGLPTLGRGHR